jgi:hypothetical protein
MPSYDMPVRKPQASKVAAEWADFTTTLPEHYVITAIELFICLHLSILSQCLQTLP